MEELEQYLQANVQEVEGIAMVPLTIAIQGMYAAHNMKVTDSLEQVMAELQNSINNLQLPDQE